MIGRRRAGALGSSAERAVARHLKRQGLRPLAQNFRCRFGEIDLVMLDATTIVFVEVRLRATGSQVSPADSVTPEKQRRLIMTAAWFLANERRAVDAPTRFDVVSVTHEAGAGGRLCFSFDWIKHAFTADGLSMSY